jgi:hypothetical protein
MTHDSARDTEIILRYKAGESERSISRSMKITRGSVDRCLTRHEITKRPRPPTWTKLEKWILIVLCENGVTGQEYKQFFPKRTYSAIKHHRDMLRNKKLIR